MRKSEQIVRAMKVFCRVELVKTKCREELVLSSVDDPPDSLEGGGHLPHLEELVLSSVDSPPDFLEGGDHLAHLENVLPQKVQV